MMWKEIEATPLRDKRLKRRLAHMVDGFNRAPTQSIPQIFGRWGDAKAAYRFFRQ
jgi:hypothetical protein